eukprot:4936331-Amphidinium_carterae.1
MASSLGFNCKAAVLYELIRCPLKNVRIPQKRCILERCQDHFTIASATLSSESQGTPTLVRLDGGQDHFAIASATLSSESQGTPALVLFDGCQNHFAIASATLSSEFEGIPV